MKKDIPFSPSLLFRLLVVVVLLLPVLSNAQQPVVASVVPLVAKVGDTITITGSNFNTTPASNVVYFGATPGKVYAATATQLKVVVDTGASYGPVSVLNMANNLIGYQPDKFLPTFTSSYFIQDSINFRNTTVKTVGLTSLSGDPALPYITVMGDLDGDGKPDLLTVNRHATGVSPGTLTIFRNVSNPGWINSSSFADVGSYTGTITVGNQPTNAKLADIDGDGMLDIVVAVLGASKVIVYRNVSTLGNISFGPGQEYSTLGIGTAPYVISVDDFDKDGKSDIAVTCRDSANIAVLRNISTVGVINFTMVGSFPCGLLPIGISTGDLDGDGLSDLATADDSSETVSILKNTTVGSVISFAPRVILTAPGKTSDMLSVDVDGDGKLDLVTTVTSAGFITFYKNNTTTGVINSSSFAPGVSFATMLSPAGLAAGDLNGDGRPDFAVANAGSNKFSVFRNTSIMGVPFSPSSMGPRFDFTTAITPIGVNMNDLDGDGYPEVVVANNNSGSISIFRDYPLPLIDTIAGPRAICFSAAPITLSNAVTGGVWTLSDPTIATINSSTGLFTPISPGLETVIYMKVAGGDTNRRQLIIRIDSMPNVSIISGPLSHCAGTAITLTNAVAGGVWQTGSPATATIVASGTTVTVTGVSGGVAPISYSFTNTCGTDVEIRFDTVKVVPSPGVITGTAAVCGTTSTTLADTAIGGVWSSVNTSIAVVSATGVVTGVVPGSTTISYTLTNSCGTSAATIPFVVNVAPNAGTVNGPVAVCAGSAISLGSTAPGGVWSTSNNAIATVSASGSVGGVAAGGVIVSYTVTNACGVAVDTQFVNVNPLPVAGTIIGGSSVCAGTTLVLGSTVTGGAWLSGSPAIATVSSGTVGGVAGGTAIISYSVTNSCGTATDTQMVAVTPQPNSGAILGSSTVCVAASITLTDAAPGGVWSASNSRATVSAGGVVTGVSAGSVTISYTVTNICNTSSSTKSVTVNALPNAGVIAGNDSVCVGQNITLTNAAGGGSWTSSAPAIASITASAGNGVVHGATAGNVFITYTVSNTCGTATDTQLVTVKPLANPGTITGPASSVCIGAVITLSNATSGGVWTSGATGIATVSGGVAGGVAAGNAIISYSVTNGCGTRSDTMMITVLPLPNAGTITGATTAACTGQNITLTNIIPAGTWSSSATGVASVNSSGVVHGNTVGSAIISYSITNSCGTDVDTQLVNVSLSPDAGVITSAVSSVCVGSVITLNNAITTGTWSSSNTARATVSGDIVGGVSAGVVIISYSVTNGCGTATDTQMITVTPLPVAVTLTGADTVCTGAAIVLSASSPGGVWSAANASAAVTGGSVAGITPGADTISYTVTNTCGSAVVSKFIQVQASPVAGSISGPSSVCTGQTITLTDTATGGTWVASNARATVSGGVVTGVSGGAVTISYIVTNTCGTVFATHAVTVDTLPSAGTITGLSSVCVGANITLANAIAGGIWGTTNANATVVGGVVTGVSLGVDTITYTVTNGCGSSVASKIVTVNNTPYADTISGPGVVCEAQTILLTNTVAGGVWSSNDTAIARVDAAGVVTGMAGGMVTITYAVTTVCGTATVTKDVLVNPLPHPGVITGLANVCIGSSITLTDTAAGGVWSASNALAAVSVSGVVTGIASGIDTISYTVTNACGSSAATFEVVIDPLPDTGIIVGASSLCVGASAALTDSVNGGIWSSSAPSVAVVNTAGVVTALSAGTTIISYTIGTGCNTLSAHHAITVNAIPSLTSSLTPPPVCDDQPFAYIPTSIGGATYVWVRDSVAGITSPSATGTGSISETFHNATALPVIVNYNFIISAAGCADTQTMTVTVNPTPQLTSALSQALCGGTVFSYNPASATPGASYLWSRAVVSGITPAVSSGTGGINDSLTNSNSSAVTVVYVFTVTANGCSNTQNVELILSPGAHMPHITTKGAPWLCANTRYQNFGTTDVPYAGEQYSWATANAAVWATGAGDQYCLVNFSTPGTSWVYLTATLLSSGCAQRDSFAVVVDANIAEVPEVLYFNGDFICTQSNEYTYQWGYDDASTLDSTIVTGETNQYYHNPGADLVGKYYWVMTTHYGCMQKTYYNTPTAISNVTAEEHLSVSVSPNPNDGTFSIMLRSAASQPAHMVVTDVVGRVVSEWNTITNNTEHINLNTAAGIYLLSATTKSGTITERIVVTR